MCGRLVIYSPPEALADYLHAAVTAPFEPGYNIAPTHYIPSCRVSEEGSRELVPMYWGLVPHWSKGPDSRFSMINARAETVHEKPAYRTPFKKHRCLIPVDGFYEWTQRNGKQPYFFHRRDNRPLALAGLWDRWRGEDGDVLESCSIVVTGANALMQPIHDRMPVILSPAQFEAWLDPQNQDVDRLRALLLPYPGDDLETYAVSTRVNNPRNEGAALLQRQA
jgi:putative SOS response-associated peptidase YedK